MAHGDILAFVCILYVLGLHLVQDLLLFLAQASLLVGLRGPIGCWRLNPGQLGTGPHCVRLNYESTLVPFTINSPFGHNPTACRFQLPVQPPKGQEPTACSLSSRAGGKNLGKPQTSPLRGLYGQVRGEKGLPSAYASPVPQQAPGSSLGGPKSFHGEL